MVNNYDILKTRTKILKSLKIILRHKPSLIGITLDQYGWASVDELIAGISKVYELDIHTLADIVETDPFERFVFNEDKTLIRAVEGHSFPVLPIIHTKTPPPFLYYGTGTDFCPPREGDDIFPECGNLYIHLYESVLPAVCRGATRGKPVIYLVNSAKMVEDGYDFHYCEGKTWMTEKIPADYYTINFGEDNE